MRNTRRLYVTRQMSYESRLGSRDVLIAPPFVPLSSALRPVVRLFTSIVKISRPLHRYFSIYRLCVRLDRSFLL